MKRLCLIFLLHCAFTFAQNTAAVNWINQHAVTIEDASPDTPLTY